MLDYWNTANNGRIVCMFLFCFFTNHYKCTRYRYKKTWTAESRPEGPASNCTSFFRRITNKYRHATVTNIDGMHQNTPKSCLLRRKVTFFFPFIPKWQERVWAVTSSRDFRGTTRLTPAEKMSTEALRKRGSAGYFSLTQPCGGTLGAPPHSRWHWRGWRSLPGTCREPRGACMSDCSNTCLVMKVQFNAFPTAGTTEWSALSRMKVHWWVTEDSVTERPWSQVAMFIHLKHVIFQKYVTACKYALRKKIIFFFFQLGFYIFSRDSWFQLTETLQFSHDANFFFSLKNKVECISSKYTQIHRKQHINPSVSSHL